jgi:hypothetical protein
MVATGGDRTLSDRVLADPRLKPLGALLRGRHLEVPDPRSAIVKDLPRLLRTVTVHVGPPADPR